MISPSEQLRTDIDQHVEDVVAGQRRGPQPFESERSFVGVAPLEVVQPVDLVVLLVVVRAGQLDRGGHLGSVRIEERVDADDRQRAVVLAMLVQHRLVLDPAALVAGLHRAQHAAALADPVELGQHGGLDEVGQFLDDEAALQRVLVHRQSPLAVDHQLDRQRSAHRLGRWAW